jgi:predicted nuclease of predicted toxin-antitoxin system
MRVLLDECLPRRLRTQLVGHEVQTVQAMGWSGKKNGELLRLAVAAGFEVFLTADQNLRYQQNLASGTIAVISLVADSIRLQDLMPLIPAVLTALDSIGLGVFVEVGREGQDPG